MKFYNRVDDKGRKTDLIAVISTESLQADTHYSSYGYMRVVQQQWGDKMGIEPILPPKKENLEFKVLQKYGMVRE